MVGNMCRRDGLPPPRARVWGRILKILTVRKIDRYAGIPACLFLTAIRRVFQVFTRGGRAARPIQRILFIKLAEQGATVVAYGAMHRAVEMVGRENVFFLSFEKNRVILDALQIIPPENAIAIRDDSFFTFASDTLRALWRIWRLKIDATIDMELFARVSAILSYLSGARRRVGLHRFKNEGLYRGDLMTHRIHYNPYLHTSKAYDVMVQAVQRDPSKDYAAKYVPEEMGGVLPRFEPRAEERDHVNELLKSHGIQLGKNPIVTLNPKLEDMVPIRSWPAERFMDLAKRILAEHPEVYVVVTGLPEEEQAINEMCKTIGSERAVSLAGDLTLRELITLYTVADVLVSSDSGPAHFASLTEIDVVVLFGPETPLLFTPLGERIHVLFSGLPCSPCLTATNHRWSSCMELDNECMKTITVDQILGEVSTCLQTRKAEL